MMEKGRTRILDRRPTGGSHYLLVLGNPFRTPFLPGQFVMLAAAGGGDPFLKRPYSVYRTFPTSAERPEGEIRLLIKSIGRGSRQMAELPIGSPVEIVGPLGKPFVVQPETKLAVFVAGGIGVAPFVELAASPAMRGLDKLALVGGRSAVDVQAIEDLQALGVETRTATEDGTLGRKGFVTALLEEFFAAGAPPGTALFSCGPEPMMKAVAAIAGKAKLPCQLSLEAIMGCGFGVCLGCVVKNAAGHYVRVCREGPVMEIRELGEFGE
ncbi:MAG: dihydroorotate dehydrogenase electron transfer subunit [Myxococcales bacterium]|nr:MAG: dihydroorotate dehydrogenase electron transfer subunit [Myxococcales bacterium]